MNYLYNLYNQMILKKNKNSTLNKNNTNNYNYI